jgi:hypothetical protein
MNKVKMFFIAAALVLTTAGVFAGKAKFATQAFYVSANGTSFTALSSGSVNLPGLSTSGTAQAKITDNSNLTYGVYYGIAGTPVTYAPVYASGW